MVPAAALWTVTVALAVAGLLSLTLTDLLVLLGVAVVLPLSLGGRVWWWRGAAGGVLAAFQLPRGAGAAGLVLPFLLVAAVMLAGRIATAGPLLFWGISDVVHALAALWAVVAAGALVVSRGGFVVLGQREPFVELTTIHYTYAGAAALVLAGAALPAATGRWRWVGGWAIALTAAAPPMVATGFVTGHPLPQVGGAVLMTLGVWLTAALQLRPAGHAGSPSAGVLLTMSGLAVWAPMILAVSWAAGQHFDLPALSIGDMARTHGLANALGFTLLGLVGRRLQITGAAAPVAVS